MVTVSDLRKTFADGTIVAVDGVSFNVSPGELFGIIGPDGAGKTTLFRMLTTLLLPDSGKAVVNGFDVVKDYRAIRKSVGYMPGRFSLYQDLSVRENLEFFATLFGTTVEENYDLIREIWVQIEPFRNRRAGKLSGGMKQKLALCCALVHKPELLFLDEPTTGVDPVSRKEFWDMLKRLVQQGIAIVVSTPYMDEASLCNRIALMQSGRILAVDTPSSIVSQYPGRLYAIRSPEIPKLLNDLRTFHNMDSSFSFGQDVHFAFRQEGPNALGELDAFLRNAGHHDVSIRPQIPTIEDCFIRLLK